MNLLNKIQQELKVPKGQFNSFGNFKYRSCEDIVEAVKPLLIEEATLTFNDEPVLIGDRYYIKATVTLTHGEKTWPAVAYAREPAEKTKMDVAQVTGTSSSYARKYALNALFCIDDTKDADTMDNSTNNATTGQNKPQKGKENKNVDKFLEDLQPTEEEVITWIENLESATTLKQLKEIASRVPALVKDKIGKAKFEEIKAKLK